MYSFLGTVGLGHQNKRAAVDWGTFVLSKEPKNFQRVLEEKVRGTSVVRKPPYRGPGGTVNET